MYFWRSKDQNITLIPTMHTNYELIDKNIITSMEKILRESDVVFFESDLKLKPKSQGKGKYLLHEFYDINKIQEILEESFKIDISNKFIKNRKLTTLTPGPGISLLTCKEFKGCMLDDYLRQYAKKINNKVGFLDNKKDKNQIEFLKMLKNSLDLIEKTMAKNPPTLKKIKEYTKLTVREIKKYNNLFIQKKIVTIKKDKDNRIGLDKRNNSWAKIISTYKNKNITICVGARHLDTSLNNNLIQILKDKYKIEFIRVNI